MNTEIKSHNPIERRIKSDLNKKNVLRKELERGLSLVKKWNFEMGHIKNKRKKKKYQKNIEMYMPKIKNNKEKLINMIPDLEKRIKEEIKFSEKEMSDLNKSYKKELAEMVEAEKKLLKAQQAKLSKDDKTEILDISIEEFQEKGKGKTFYSKEFIFAKARKKLNKEIKDVENVDKEIKSEERDKILFKNELQRMSVEKEILT